MRDFPIFTDRAAPPRPAQSGTERHQNASITSRLFRSRRFESHLRRLFAKVNKNGPTVQPELGPCWLWIGHTNGKGYGQLCIDRVRMLAHQFFYRLLIGPVPDGLELDHLCRIKLCVRPAHLQPVTHVENMRRSPEGMAAGGLARAAALTPERRSEIALLAARGRWAKVMVLVLALALAGCATTAALSPTERIVLFCNPVAHAADLALVGLWAGYAIFSPVKGDINIAASDSDRPTLPGVKCYDAITDRVDAATAHEKEGQP